MRVGNGNEGFTPINVVIESEEEYMAILACLEIGTQDEYQPDSVRWSGLELIAMLQHWREVA